MSCCQLWRWPELLHRSLCLCLALNAGAVLAAQSGTTPVAEPAVQGEAPSQPTRLGRAYGVRVKPLWEFGIGGVGLSQLAYPGSGVRVERFLAVPYFIYRGPIIRVDDGDLALRAIRSERVELDLGLAAAFGSKSSEVPVREGMPSLGTLLEIGPRLSYRFGLILPGRSNKEHPLTLELPLRGVFDASDSFGFRGWTFEPKLQWRRKLPARFDLRISTGLLFGTRKINNYFYGVAPQFATESRAAYEANSGLIAARLGIFLGRRISRNWRLVGFARLDHVGGATNRSSPLVERQTGWTAGLGFSWKMFESKQPASR
ncbi:MAG: MipA/OmpV family protein [Burkholderiaceae bacterium]